VAVKECLKSANIWRRCGQQDNVQVNTESLQCIYTVSKKTRHLIFYHHFGKLEPIFKILSQPYS